MLSLDDTAHSRRYGGPLAPWPSNGETSKAPQELLPKHDGYPQVSDQQLSGPKASSSVTIEFIEQAPAAFPMHDSKIQKALPTGGKVKRHTVIASSLVDNWVFAKAGILRYIHKNIQEST